MKNQDNLIMTYANDLLPGIAKIIERSRQKATVFLNAETTLMYWSIGNFVNLHLKEHNRLEYGSQILATLSQQLTESFGKGFTYSALTRMCKSASVFEERIVVTLSQQLSWSHLINRIPNRQWFSDELNCTMKLFKINYGLKKEDI